MTLAPRQQALTLVCVVRSGAEESLRAELAALGESLQEAFRALPSLHFARFLLLPSAAADAELVFELGFDGALAPLLAALWAIAGSLLLRVFRHCQSSELPRDAGGFANFVARHGRRADAAYAAHDGLSVAVIRNDAALDRLLQAELDRAVAPEAVADHGPLEIAVTLQERARAAPGAFLGTLVRAGDGRRDPLEPIRRRLGDVLLSLALLPLLELGQALLALSRPAKNVSKATLDSPLLREQGPLAQLVPVKPGRFRLWLLKLLLWLSHGWLGQRAGGHGRALSHLHNARWLILPGRRLLFLAHADLGPDALLASRSAWERRLSALIWQQSQGFPGGLRFAFSAARREAALREWLRRSLLPTELWYSAYSGLTVAEIERNHRVRELLGRNLDRELAGELCALL